MPHFTRSAADAAAELSPPHGRLALALCDVPADVQAALASRADAAVPLAMLPNLDSDVWRTLYRAWGAAKPYATALTCRPLTDELVTWLAAEGEWREQVWASHLDRAGLPGGAAGPRGRQLATLVTARSGGLTVDLIRDAATPGQAAARFEQLEASHGPPSAGDQMLAGLLDQLMGMLTGPGGSSFPTMSEMADQASAPLDDPAFTDLHLLAQPWQALDRPVNSYATATVAALRGRARRFAAAVTDLLGSDIERWQAWFDLLGTYGSLFYGPGGGVTPLGLARHAAAGTTPAGRPAPGLQIIDRRPADGPADYAQALAWAVDIADEANHASFAGDGDLLESIAVCTRDGDAVSESDVALHDTVAHRAYRQLAAVHGREFTVGHRGEVHSDELV